MCNTPIDWTKPIEYVSSSSHTMYPARLLCSDRKGLNPYVVLYTSVHGNEEFIAVTANGSMFGAIHQYIRNVPPPKKKMWRAELSKPGPQKIIVSERPLHQLSNGELNGWQGWALNKLEVVEV